MWRSLSLVITGFWLLMSSLLVRYVWFPEGTNFAEVPPRMVLQQFLEQASAAKTTAGTLHIYHRDRKIGEANVSCRRSRDSAADFALHVNGTLDGALPNVDGEVHFGFTLRLADVDRFGELKGNLRFERARKIIDFHWPRGAKMPSIILRGGEEAEVNAQLMQAVVAQMIAGNGASAMAESLGVAPEADVASLIQMKARDYEMDFAGQRSKGYQLEFMAMDHWKARAFITEAGELALLNLPEGYRLVEPVIHGLARDYDAEDAAEAAAEAAKEAAEAGASAKP